MKVKSNLKVVEAKETKVEVLNKLSEVRAKYLFMRCAISELWGSNHSTYGEEVVLGCNLLMDDIGEDLQEIHKGLDPEYAP